MPDLTSPKVLYEDTLCRFLHFYMASGIEKSIQLWPEDTLTEDDTFLTICLKASGDVIQITRRQVEIYDYLERIVKRPVKEAVKPRGELVEIKEG